MTDGSFRKKLHVFVICWTGWEEASRRIARALEKSVDFLTVIYSNKAGSTETGAGEWIQVPDDWFYGRKFEKSLELNAGDIMLHITADAHSDDWPALAHRCRELHKLHENLAVWAPDIDHTDWHTEIVRMGSLEDPRLLLVSQTDSIVWSLSGPVLERMPQLAYDMNNLGWGIDWLAISHAKSRRLLVIRDLSVKVLHPAGTAYHYGGAEEQMHAFLAQMTPPERRQFQKLSAFSTWERRNAPRRGLRRFAGSIARRIIG